MGRKMRLPSLFRGVEARPPAWQWPPCTQPRTLSFRTADNIFNISGDTPDSLFTNSLFESRSFSTASDDGSGEEIETVIQGLRAERLFFKLGETSSILEEAKEEEDIEVVFKESVVLAMDSRDPYLDFRTSMSEMMEAHGLRKWRGLEQLLCWYLGLNAESSHGYILKAFADSLVTLAFSSSSSCSCCRHCRRFDSSSSSTNDLVSSAPQTEEIEY